jgi:hypothetical protein
MIKKLFIASIALFSSVLPAATTIPLRKQIQFSSRSLQEAAAMKKRPSFSSKFDTDLVIKSKEMKLSHAKAKLIYKDQLEDLSFSWGAGLSFTPNKRLGSPQFRSCLSQSLDYKIKAVPSRHRCLLHFDSELTQVADLDYKGSVSYKIGF